MRQPLRRRRNRDSSGESRAAPRHLPAPSIKRALRHAGIGWRVGSRQGLRYYSPNPPGDDDIARGGGHEDTRGGGRAPARASFLRSVPPLHCNESESEAPRKPQNDSSQP
eukprot:gene13015-biopygen2446